MTGPWTVSDDEAEALAAEAMNVAEAAWHETPDADWWGFESYGDAPAGIGGGVGGFSWFREREAMLDFVGRLLTFFSPGPASADHGEVAGRAAAVVARVRSGELSMDEGLAHLNEVLRRFSQLRWWGQLSELLCGDRPFEREIRAWARGAESGADPSRPIDEAERPAFIEGLRDFGL